MYSEESKKDDTWKSQHDTPEMTRLTRLFLPQQDVGLPYGRCIDLDWSVCSIKGDSVYSRLYETYLLVVELVGQASIHLYRTSSITEYG